MPACVFSSGGKQVLLRICKTMVNKSAWKENWFSHLWQNYIRKESHQNFLKLGHEFGLMLLIWSCTVGIVCSRGVQVREHVVHIKSDLLHPCPVPRHWRLEMLILQILLSLLIPLRLEIRRERPWLCVVWGHVRLLWAAGAKPCLWVKPVLFGLETRRRTAESGQHSVTVSMAVRGWCVSDRPVRGSGQDPTAKHA